MAAWGAVSGILPHVLHHVGPLAGTALVAGAGGQMVFAAVGFLAAVPSLLRLKRRFGTWLAPGIAAVLFAAAFIVSTFFIGPIISGEGASEGADPKEAPAQTDEHGH